MQKYTGSCHCGDVRYAVELELDRLVACNCSICSRSGWLLAFVPAARFQLETPEDAMTDYQFGPKRIHHVFCRRCGVRPFSWGHDAEGNKTMSINVRCLEGVDPSALPVQEFDGRSM